jgi:hypothetical protein
VVIIETAQLANKSISYKYLEKRINFAIYNRQKETEWHEQNNITHNLPQSPPF